jgi:hypothetical protein
MRTHIRAAIAIAACLAAALLALPLDAQDPAGAMRVALLVDTSEAATPALPHIRTGVAAFIDALPPEDEILLVSIGRRVQVRVQPTTDHKKLTSAAASLLSDGGPTPIADALIEINDRFMKQADHPVFVIVTGDGPDSSIRTDDNTFNAFLQRLRSRHIPAHAFVIKSKGNGMAEAIASMVVRASGGRLEPMSNGATLAEKMKALAAFLGRGE